ncbi:hypothetical protein [Amycolatopsis sp. BJA-103]|uniref:hypothetical protein n=1 Tax=Amycolatopsis sp. BJA-103 TaxID=1911175 RepID=UPI0011AF2E0A|nr:hypothetical protein [Amycolatopsis sp. BJA-103]
MNPLDEGVWLVSNERQIIATFYLPLPEPLALASGTQIPTYLRFYRDSIEILNNANIDLLFQSLEISPGMAILETAEQRRLHRSSHGRENWSNKAWLSSSILIHQVASDLIARTGLDAVAAAAEATSSGKFNIDEVELSTIRPLSSELRAHLADAAKIGVGTITVAEIAVPTRIIGGQLEFENMVSSEPHIHGSEDPNTQSDTWDFIDGRSISAQDPKLAHRLYSALAVAVKDLRDLQKAYHAVMRAPISLVARERLPQVLPVILRQHQDIGNPTNSTKTLIEVNRNLWPLILPPLMKEEKLKSLNHARSKVNSGAFSAYLDLHREADAALYRQGDTRLGSLLWALSAESLLDELLLHSKWEEKMTPEEAANSWINGLDTRIKREYSSRFGGSWDTSKPGPIRAWSTRVADLRNRIVHGAYIPTALEAQLAGEAVTSLTTFLCDRLSSQNTLRRLPRTALALAAESGLRRRNAFTKSILALQQDRSEPPWDETFKRWRNATSRIRRDSSTSKREPIIENATLLAVVHSNGEIKWCAHDYTNHLAAPMAYPRDLINKAQLEALESIRREYVSHGYNYPISHEISYDGELPAPVGNWVEEYHLVPLAGVMVDKSDYSIVAPLGHSE